nr:hypothetical protein [Escherichia coli]
RDYRQAGEKILFGGGLDMKKSIILLNILLIFMQGDIRQAAAPRLPDGPIEIVVPAEPSGGWEVTAQAIQSVLRQKQIVKDDVHIVYKSGGGGEKGWKYVNKSS